MNNTLKYLKTITILTIFAMSICFIYGCSANKEMQTIKEQEVQEMNDFNDFQGVLINIQSTHPGTAGCSLQALYDAKDLLNFCKAKLPFDVMAKAWAENLYDSEIADTHDSFVFQLETLERLTKGNDKKEFDDNDIENDAPYDKELYNIAINAVKTIIDCTK